ncbi:MAG TPA: cyclic nucleotide-binding domain-containing protein [Myxococcaceae bacterium]|nr:cyclic nucleotide-binding domain-containing protein [Myxococcaceae bacterium]
MTTQALLSEVPLFAGLTRAQLDRIAAVGKVRRYPARSHVFHEGDPGEEMFIVLNGAVRVSKSLSGLGEEALAILEPGQSFGEMSIIDDSPRSADAIVHRECELLVLSRQSLDELMFTDKDLAYVLLWAFVHTLSGRLRETNEKLKTFFASSRFE